MKSQKQPQPKFYNVSQAAERLSVDVKTVRNWIALGKFPGAFKVGPGRTSSFAIPVEEVESYKKQERDQVLA
jgi:excisionase family DNA binding protein